MPSFAVMVCKSTHGLKTNIIKAKTGRPLGVFEADITKHLDTQTLIEKEEVQVFFCGLQGLIRFHRLSRTSISLESTAGR